MCYESFIIIQGSGNTIEINGKQYYGVIYKIENTITHRVYIGQTTHPKGFNGRYFHSGIGIERVYKYLKCQEKCNGRANQYLLRSIEKCGFDAFKVDEIIDVAETMQELNDKETYYIKLYDSYKNGYNMSFGGDSCSGMPRPSGKDCPNSKQIYQISLDGKIIKLWDSATEASTKLNIDASSISMVCKHKRKTAGNYVWVLKSDYIDDIDYSQIPNIKDRGSGTKAVLLLSDDNAILKEYYSGRAASFDLGISLQYVSRICKHQTTNTKLNLIFKDEYLEEQRLNG